jgi:RimJ/RimL family protein N-acetyltransferase
MAPLEFPHPPLTDGVVLLRAWAPGDVGFVVAACQDPEVSRYSPIIPFPYTEADARGWFAMQEPGRLAGAVLDFAVAAAADGRPLGAISLKVNPLLRSGEAGYWLSREARGAGSMSRALRLLCAWGFESLGLERIELTTDPHNVGSQRVAERCGFQREGLMRSHLRIFHSGERRDSVMYGLLPGELVVG